MGTALGGMGNALGGMGNALGASPSFPRSAWECRLRRSASWPERNGRLTGDTIDIVPGVLAHPAERGKTGSHAPRGNQGKLFKL